MTIVALRRTGGGDYLGLFSPARVSAGDDVGLGGLGLSRLAVRGIRARLGFGVRFQLGVGSRLGVRLGRGIRFGHGQGFGIRLGIGGSFLRNRRDFGDPGRFLNRRGIGGIAGCENPDRETREHRPDPQTLSVHTTLTSK